MRHPQFAFLRTAAKPEQKAEANFEAKPAIWRSLGAFGLLKGPSQAAPLRTRRKGARHMR
jgi:hypothetical protein